MKERIKVTDIIDFQRDENDANRYYFGFWTDFDYWEIAFTLKDGEISDILLYDEEDYNRRYHVEESFAIDGKAKTLATKTGNTWWNLRTTSLKISRGIGGTGGT